MKYFFPIFVLLSGAVVAGAQETVYPLRVMTFNIMVELSKLPHIPEWAERKHLVAGVIRERAPDVLGVQEATPNQLAYLEAELTGYTAHGTIPLERINGQPVGKSIRFFEAAGITAYTDAILLYRTDLFEAVETGWFSLSPTPDELATGFGNFFPRVVVWAKLRHKPSGVVFLAATTHFDNNLPVPNLSAALAMDRLNAMLEPGMPAFFIGDFNTDQKRGDYARLTAEGWRDAYTVAAGASPDGRDDLTPTHDRKTRIDHILYFGEQLRAVSWTRVESPEAALRMSDHWPVFAEFGFTVAGVGGVGGSGTSP